MALCLYGLFRKFWTSSQFRFNLRGQPGACVMHDERSNVPTAIHPASHDVAQRTVMLFGIVGSCVCTVLGYPCAAPESWVSLTFRGLCFGYFICTLLPYLWGPGTLSRYLLRICYVCNSLGAFLCSYSWCGGNIELVAVILWTVVFQAFCLLVLVQTHVIHHVFFTVAGSVFFAGFIGIETSTTHRNTKWWAFSIVILGTVWVLGIFRTRHWSIVFLQRCWDFSFETRDKNTLPQTHTHTHTHAHTHRSDLNTFQHPGLLKLKHDILS